MECQCGHRECRKEPKELLALPLVAVKDLAPASASAVNPEHERIALSLVTATLSQAARSATAIQAARPDIALDDAKPETFLTTNANQLSSTIDTTPAAMAGLAGTFIGGGCCVHLSIEFSAGAAPGGVGVFVFGADGTTVAWVKVTPAGSGYQVKENIVTTKPGASVVLVVANATARLRWCEIFSC
jgi:hypothetical protein